jgi:hypothetical protein
VCTQNRSFLFYRKVLRKGAAAAAALRGGIFRRQPLIKAFPQVANSCMWKAKKCVLELLGVFLLQQPLFHTIGSNETRVFFLSGWETVIISSQWSGAELEDHLQMEIVCSGFWRPAGLAVVHDVIIVYSMYIPSTALSYLHSCILYNPS